MKFREGQLVRLAWPYPLRSVHIEGCGALPPTKSMTMRITQVDEYGNIDVEEINGAWEAFGFGPSLLQPTLPPENV